VYYKLTSQNTDKKTNNEFMVQIKMKRSHLVGALWASFCLLNICVSPAHAITISGQGTWESTLEGRDLDGNTATFEAYYDTVLNTTWLADANAGAGSVFDNGSSTIDGKMTWENANAWAAGLDVYGVTGWRLPTLSPIDGNSFNRTYPTYDGTSDAGWTLTTTDGSDGGWRDINGNPVSELGHMFYVNLGNLGSCDPYDSDSSTAYCAPQEGFGLKNTGPFSNVSDALYWFDTEATNSAGWNFYTGHGRQKDSQKWRLSFAWAVLDGDVAAVPVPAAVWLFSSGLLGLIGISRRKKQV
jgi:hypothetical protein